jgi:hypothetical protein
VAAEDESNPGPTEQQLGLQDYHMSMIKSLNSLQWAKYPVHIHNSWNPQYVAAVTLCTLDNIADILMGSTAILVFKVWRQDTCEGKVVVRHYKDKFVVDDS